MRVVSFYHCFWSIFQQSPPQRAHGTIITSVLCQNDVTTSFWRYNDVIIAACVRWNGNNTIGKYIFDSASTSVPYFYCRYGVGNIFVAIVDLVPRYSTDSTVRVALHHKTTWRLLLSVTSLQEHEWRPFSSMYTCLHRKRNLFGIVLQPSGSLLLTSRGTMCDCKYDWWLLYDDIENRWIAKQLCGMGTFR